MAVEVIGVILVVIVGVMFVVLRLGLAFPRVSSWMIRKLDGDDDGEL